MAAGTYERTIYQKVNRVDAYPALNECLLRFITCLLVLIFIHMEFSTYHGPLIYSSKIGKINAISPNHIGAALTRTSVFRII